MFSLRARTHATPPPRTKERILFPYVATPWLADALALHAQLCLPHTREPAAERLLAQIANANGSLLGQNEPEAGRGNLWIAQAAFAWSQTHPDPFRSHLLPYLKKLGQAIIAGTVGQVAMSDSGMLVATNPNLPLLERNLLWYNLISLLGNELPAINDPAADHFDRLAARFRRAFTKAAWCTAHNLPCDPAAIADPNHPASSPDGSAILAAMLPFSPLPRTRQRTIVETFTRRLNSPGILLEAPDGPYASPLLLAWVAEGYARAHENTPAARAHARQILSDILPLAQANTLARAYRNNAPLTDPDPLTALEVQRVAHTLQPA